MGRQASKEHGNKLAKKELVVEENVAPEKPKESTVEFLSSLAAVLVTGLFIITFVVQAFEIPSSSMENTLLIGDHVFVTASSSPLAVRGSVHCFLIVTCISAISWCFSLLPSPDFTW